MGAEPPPALQSPELLGPRPLGQQSAARPSASPTMASSGSSSTSSGTFALGPWGRITSQGICGWPGQGFSANVSTSPPRPRTVGTHRTGPRFPGVRCAQGGVGGGGGGGHRSFVLLLWHTHGFSVLFSGKTVLCQGARCGGPGAGGGWERVLCWDEALYPHIFLWEREPGSSVALPPSVASSAQGPSAFCLAFPSP